MEYGIAIFLAPPYLAELCRPVVHLTGRRHLRSAASGKLDVQRTATAIGRTVAGTLLFPARRLGTVYQLNCVCRQTTLSTATFARLLKTHLFVNTE